jgi:3,4-dihydroxy 2-butanone 4-phosphate synthase
LTQEVLEEGIDQAEAIAALGKEFRTPGHIPVCREVEFGLERRQGHTELAVGLARAAGTVPVVIGAEMLEPAGDAALQVADAEAWATQHGIPFVHGSELLTYLGLSPKA